MKYTSKLLPYRETEETRAYTKAIEKGQYSQFVVPVQRSWIVKNHNPDQKVLDYNSKIKAIAAAQELAAKHNAEVFVFDDKGRITERFVARG